ncbi:MAG: NTP transferase domain-containing protein, partial [Ruminiclostridium sp.]|nr:NTP transferase domain-containing protein [Ruminiclostridium sp.]
MKAVILAGGEGTRLRPVTCNLPKPLVPVAGKPVLEYILELLAENGCDEAVIAVHYRYEKIERHFSSGHFKGIKIRFSRETEPLGTAGCVKKAASHFDNDFIVISGDAICDFELSKAFDFHKKNNAEATIITRQVDDPREYGLIIEKDNRITDFCEKPSYVNCRSDLANTGVYILSPAVLGLIPENESCDFAKNVFPEMLDKNMKLMSYEENGYWCDMGDIPAYKRCTTDILDGRLRGYSKKDHIIGKGCLIDSTALIAGKTVIGDNVSVSRNAKLRNAVIMNGAFIGENTTLNDCIICSDARIENGAAVYENAVVGESSEIGENAVICGNIKVWQNKTIENGAFVNTDRKYGVRNPVEMNDDGICGETNTVITPGFAGRLGCAVSKISENCIAVASSEDTAAETLKNALLSGISSTGKQCFDCGNVPLPPLLHTAGLLNCDLIVHISAKTRTDIRIYNRGMLPLTRVQERMLENALNRGEYLTASWDNFSSINKFTGTASLYNAMLDSITDFEIPYSINIECPNSFSGFYTPFLAKIGTGRSPLVITLNERLTEAEISDDDGNTIDYSSMVMLASEYELIKGNEISLPFAFPRAADIMAERYGKKIQRFYTSSMDNRDLYARSIAAKEKFLYDGFVLAVSVLKFMAENAMSVPEALARL